MLESFKKQIATRQSIFVEVPAVIGECVSTNIIKRFKPLKPTVLQVNVNATCNARCGMCNIWKTEDKAMLSIQELDRILSDPLFRNVQYVIVAGGEPTLRKDLPQLVIQMMEKMPKLRKISIPTTGIATERSVHHFSAIAKACLARKVFLSIGISLDGVDGVYERVRGVPGGYQKVINTLLALKKLNQEIEFSLGIGTTISSLNVYDVYRLTEVSERLQVGICFVVAALSESYFNNADLLENITFAPEAKEFLKKFLKEQIKKTPLLSEMLFYYAKVLEMMDGARRSIPCPYSDQGLVIDASGDVHYCTNSRPIGNLHQRGASSIYYDPKNLAYRQRVTKEVCPSCEISCFVGVGLRKTVFPFLRFLAKQSYQRTLAQIRNHRLSSKEAKQ